MVEFYRPTEYVEYGQGTFVPFVPGTQSLQSSKFMLPLFNRGDMEAERDKENERECELRSSDDRR